MKAIYLITKFTKGMGPINQAYNLSSAMKKLGFDFKIVCLSPEIPGKSWEDRFKDAKIDYVQLNKSAKDVLGTLKSLKEYISENNVDIIHSSGIRPDLYNVLLGHKVKHITTQRCEPENIGERGGKLVKFISTKMMLYALRRMDKIVGCSRSLSKHINDNFKFSSVYVQNGVDVDVFKPINSEEKNNLREELALPKNKKIFLYCGSFLQRKDIDTLLKAFMNQTEDNVLVLVGGEAEEVENYKKLYPRENILFLGKKSTPLKYLQCSDFMVSASLSEGLPNSVLESLACAVPVILSDIGPHIEILENGKVGESFPCKSIDGLNSAIDKALKCDYKTLQDNCLNVVDEHFSKYIMAKNYVNLYNKVINE